MRNDELQPNRDGEGKESLSPENQQRLVDVLSNALLQAMQKPPEKKEEGGEQHDDGEAGLQQHLEPGTGRPGYR